MPNSTFERLVRFEDAAGAIHYGEVPAGVAWDAELVGVEVDIYDGDVPWGAQFAVTGKRARIAKVSFFLFLNLFSWGRLGG